MIIFNKSLSSILFPDDCQRTRVTPLFKQSELTDVNNYRPISVISVIATVFERIVYDQLFSFWLMKRLSLANNKVSAPRTRLSLLS